MAAEHNLAMRLARRQKRLYSWVEKFSALPAPVAEETRNNLQTFSLLIAKLAKNPESPEAAELEQRLQTLERSLTQLFEEYRLRTTALDQARIQS